MKDHAEAIFYAGQNLLWNGVNWVLDRAWDLLVALLLNKRVPPRP